MDLLYPDMQAEGAAVFGWLMIAFVLMSMTYIFGSLVTAHGNIRALNLISFTGFILNLVLNIIYIPKHLAVGSALATTLTQSLVFIAHAWVVHKTFTERISAAIWIKSLVFICLVSAGGWASSLVPLNWPLQMGISLLWIVPAAFASGMVQLRDLKNSMLALADAIGKRTEA
jgi:O-antigen/teichoic acid export membrane protein